VVALALLGVLVVAGATVAYARARPADAAALQPVATSSAAEPAGASGASIVVHIVGAVEHPGVYDFTEGARVVDAVRAAGGFTGKADRAAVNLARALADGEQIVIPRRGQATTPASGGGPAGGDTGGKVNLNSATAADLEALPGIGPVLAQRIVDYREQHGPFRAVTDLQKVSGIGAKTYASLEPLITV